MAKAWINQDSKQVAKYGADAASWYVYWLDPAGKKRCKSCGPGSRGKRSAEKLRDKRQAELIEETYLSAAKMTWKEFRAEYEAKVLGKMAPLSQEIVVASLDHFERIVKPGKLAGIETTTIDEFIARRRLEPGKKKGDKVSPATINKELSYIRAALFRAKRWKYLTEVPVFELEKVPGKLPRYVTPEHFAQIYTACDQAERPDALPYSAADWWRGLLTFGYMIGWRITAMRALRRDDVDLAAGMAISWHEDNKGKRDVKVPLHPVIVEHLRKMPGFDELMFPWPYGKAALYEEFTRIQEAAGVHLPCRGDHEHTPYCHVYGFHDLRRAFATMNADQMTPEALQHLMQHRSYSTTKRYININRQIKEAVATLHVPDVLKSKLGG